MAYFLVTFTPVTGLSFLGTDRDINGLKEQRRRYAEKEVSPGDVFLCYLIRPPVAVVRGAQGPLVLSVGVGPGVLAELMEEGGRTGCRLEGHARPGTHRCPPRARIGRGEARRAACPDGAAACQERGRRGCEVLCLECHRLTRTYEGLAKRAACAGEPSKPQ